jgi:hypothetical protein
MTDLGHFPVHLPPQKASSAELQLFLPEKPAVYHCLSASAHFRLPFLFVKKGIIYGAATCIARRNQAALAVAFLLLSHPGWADLSVHLQGWCVVKINPSLVEPASALAAWLPLQWLWRTGLLLSFWFYIPDLVMMSKGCW